MKARQIAQCLLTHSRVRSLIACGLASLCLFLTMRSVRAADLPTDRAQTLTINPAVIELGGRSQFQQVVVTAEVEDGRSIDVTRHCQLTIADTAVATLNGATVVGTQNGVTGLSARLGRLSAASAVTVSDFQPSPSVYFESDVIPLLTKHGCNGGGCHGKQSGQNGFKLSVFGFDPLQDYLAITKEGRGRRLVPAAPRQSLFVRKATGQVPHGGGQRMHKDSHDARLIADWVRQGTPYDNESAPRLTRLSVFPVERILGQAQDQQLLITAHYSDGRARDVTTDAAYTSNAEFIAMVEPGGLVKSGSTAGEAGITISYMGHVAVATMLVPRQPSSEPYPETPELGPIDELVWAKLKKMRIAASEICDDATFLRRLYIDTIGTLPAPDEVREFLADQSDGKRRQAIERVLNRKEYADFWAQRWADILLVDRKALGERGAYEFHRWLRLQMADNRPYDEWVREILTASGNSAKYGPVNFFRALRTPEELTRGVSQAFMGVRLDCAQCHHHPFDKWSQHDFYGLAGYFNGMKLETVQTGREFVFHAGYKPTEIPRTGEGVATRPPDGEAPSFTPDDDPRIQLAGWLTDEENPWFARIVVNRLWKHFLGRGLVEPEDDLRLTNPATNEPLLRHLEQELIDHSFDVKHLMRQILNSRVYQLSSIPNKTNADDAQNFSHYTVKRLRAEVLLDALNKVAGTVERFPGRRHGTRAIELWDNRFPSYFLDTFGRSERTSPCACGESGSPTMPQTLHLMNAPEINAKIVAENGRLAKLLKRRATQREIVEELCLAALGRFPNESELRVAESLFAETSAQKASEDFLWTLLNSYDFLCIH